MDSREASNRNGRKTLNLLDELGAETIIRKLDFGDYLIDENTAIERKTVFDLANTLTHRFLFNQIFQMKKAYSGSIVLIEGYLGNIRKFRRIRSTSLSGALFALAKTNIPLIPTIDCKDTASFLITAAKQLLNNKKKHPTIRHRIKTENIKKQQLFVVAGLPRIGPVLSENLLRYLGTVRDVYSSSKEELMTVNGIGPQIAETP